MKARYIQSNW